MAIFKVKTTSVTAKPGIRLGSSLACGGQKQVVLRTGQAWAPRKARKGTSIVEVMVAVVIFMLVIIGSAMMFATGMAHISRQGHRRAAVHLAAQKLEYLKGCDYDELVQPDEPEAAETLPVGDVSYTRITEIQDHSLYKEVKVTINWSHIPGWQHSVILTTFIAPK